MLLGLNQGPQTHLLDTGPRSEPGITETVAAPVRLAAPAAVRELRDAAKAMVLN